MELDFVHIIADHGPGAMWQDVAQEDHGQSTCNDVVHPGSEFSSVVNC